MVSGAGENSRHDLFATTAGRLWLGAVIVLLGLHAVLAWYLRAPAISTGHDDATYLLLARDLTHFEYRNFWIVGAPRHSQYPPVYPLALALVGAGREGGLTNGIWLNIGTSVAALGVFAAVASRWYGRAVALAGLAVAAVNPSLLSLAGQVRSEPLFMLCFAGATWAAHRAGRREAVGATFLAVGAALTRTIGVTLVAGLIVSWLIQRRWRDALVSALVSLVLVGGWLGWSFAARSHFAGQSYWADAVYQPETEVAPPGAAVPPATAVPPAPPRDSVAPPATAPPVPPAASAVPSGRRGLLQVLFLRVATNAREYLTVSLPSVFSIPGWPDTAADGAIGAGLGLVLAAWGLIALYRREPFPIAALLLYGALLLVWPYRVSRFLAPLVPVISVVVVAGAAWPARRFRWRLPWLGPAVLGVILGGFGLRQDRAALAVSDSCDRSRPFESEGCYSPLGRGFFQAVLEAGRMSSTGAVFLTPKMATLHYLVDRPSVDELEAASLDSEGLERLIQRHGVQFALVSKIHDDQWAIAKSLSGHCERWRLERSFDGGTTLLLRRAAAESSGESLPEACPAIARFLATGS